MSEMPGKNEEVTLAVLGTKVDYLTEEIKELNKMVKGSYLTKVEFEPIKKLVYGTVGIILTAVVGAILTLIVM